MRGEDSLRSQVRRRRRGSPPHARGRPWKAGGCMKIIRITPACAGKTTALHGARQRDTDHPRMRGEDSSSTEEVSSRFGITPACAGKTGDVGLRKSLLTDHPRMRGEDALVGEQGPELVNGSPPHARGRRTKPPNPPSRLGITPACAGKTPQGASDHGSARDHPRMRGEDLSLESPATVGEGSPPHARGRHRRGRLAALLPRITPACAGKTLEPAFLLD